MATLLHRFFEHYGLELGEEEAAQVHSMFTDAYLIDDWAATGTAAIVDMGLMMGHPDGRFGPQEHATRAQMAVLFLRILDANFVILPDEPTDEPTEAPTDEPIDGATDEPTDEPTEPVAEA